MRVRLTLGWLVVVSLLAAIGQAQQPPASTLSLADAIDLARRNNPSYQALVNDRAPAAWQARVARLNLITPGIGASATHSFTNSGTRSDFFGIPQSTPATSSQSYNIGINYSLSGQTFAVRGQADAIQDAVEADITAYETVLGNLVRVNYLNALQAQAQLDLARRSLERARENHSLAQARYSVGQGTLIDVRRAEVERGQAEVALLRAEQAVTNEQLRLFQTLGTPKPDANVVLTDSFAVAPRTWNAGALITQAMADNPTLLALRSRQASASWGVRAARSEFLPSLNFNAGFSGSRTTIQVDTTQAGSGPLVGLTQGNKNPFGFSITASLPLYDRFGRNARISNAIAQSDDLRLQIRGFELQVRTDVTAALNGVQAAYQTIDIQRRNREASAEALELATQRYRVGSGTYIELLDARIAAERADTDYIAAVYDYHRAIATLENAVGRPLR